MSTPFAILLGVIALGFLARIPVGFVMISASAAYLLASGQDVGIMADQIVGSMFSNYVMLAIPMFILAANIMNASQITDRLWQLASITVGRMRGGDGHVTVLVNIMMSSMSGSAVADAAGPGLIAIRQQVARGYPRGFAIAISAASATIAPIIPPSIAVVLYCVVANTSVAAMFLGGVIPGLIMGAALMVTISMVAEWRQLPFGDRITSRDAINVIGRGMLPMTLPLIILGGIWLGIFTPTEAAAAASFYALVLGTVIYRSMNLSALWQTFKESMRASAGVMLMIIGAFAINYAVAAEQIGPHLAAFLEAQKLSPVEFLIYVNIIFLLAGCFVDTTVLLLIIVPLLIPSLESLGINLVHFGVVIVVNVTIGLITPPYGLLLFVLSGLTGAPMIEIAKEIWIFIIPLVICLLAFTFIPALVLMLPAMFGY